MRRDDRYRYKNERAKSRNQFGSNESRLRYNYATRLGRYITTWLLLWVTACFFPALLPFFFPPLPQFGRAEIPHSRGAASGNAVHESMLFKNWYKLQQQPSVNGRLVPYCLYGLSTLFLSLILLNFSTCVGDTELNELIQFSGHHHSSLLEN